MTDWYDRTTKKAMAEHIEALEKEIDASKKAVRTAFSQLTPEAILALPSEYSDDEQWMLDEFAMRSGLEDCRSAVRAARDTLMGVTK